MDKNTEFNRIIKFKREFLKKALTYVKPAYKVILTTLEISSIPIQLDGFSKREIFHLCWEKGKHVITQEEQMILDKFKGYWLCHIHFVIET